MLKKFVSMTTAALMMATGISVIGAGAAHAGICNGAELLDSSSTIKGVTFTKGSRLANSYDFNGNSMTGSVRLTAAQASGSGTTSITASGGATATWLYVSPAINSWGNSDISTTDNHQNVTFANGRIFEIKISGSGCTDYYRINIIVTGSSSGNSASTSTSSGAAILGSATVSQQRQRVAAISASKTALSEAFGNGKAGSLAAFAAAGLNVSSETALERVNAKLLLLPIEKRSKIEEIEKIVDLENFVDRISNSESRPTITTTQLVSRGFIGADNRLKVSLTNALLNRDSFSLNSVEKIKAAIVEETARIQERAKRTAEIKARIATRNK